MENENYQIEDFANQLKLGEEFKYQMLPFYKKVFTKRFWAVLH